jgi:hypothetical protein
MLRPLPLLGQLVAYVFIALGIGTLAHFPSYRPFSPDMARLTISFAHIGQRKEACTKLTPEEIAQMAENMRRAELCPRERHPIFVELRLGDELLLSELVAPTGLAGDSASQLYRRFDVVPGTQRLAVGLRDTPEGEGFDYTKETEVTLAPGQSLVLDFRSEMGGFYFPGKANGVPPRDVD